MLAALTNALRVVGKNARRRPGGGLRRRRRRHGDHEAAAAPGRRRHHRVRPAGRPAPRHGRPEPDLAVAGRAHQPATTTPATCAGAIARRGRVHRGQRAEPAHRRRHRHDGRRSRSSSRWPTPTRRSTRGRPASTPRWSRPAAPTSPTRSTTCWPSPACSAACSTPHAEEFTEEMALAAARAIADVVGEEKLNPTVIVPERLRPAGGPGGGRGDPRGGQGRAAPRSTPAAMPEPSWRLAPERPSARQGRAVSDRRQRGPAGQLADAVGDQAGHPGLDQRRPLRSCRSRSTASPRCPPSISAATVAGSPSTSATAGLQQTTSSSWASGTVSASKPQPQQAAPHLRGGLADQPHHLRVEALHDRAVQQVALGDHARGSSLTCSRWPAA